MEETAYLVWQIFLHRVADVSVGGLLDGISLGVFREGDPVLRPATYRVFKRSPGGISLDRFTRSLDGISLGVFREGSRIETGDLQGVQEVSWGDIPVSITFREKLAFNIDRR